MVFGFVFFFGFGVGLRLVYVGLKETHHFGVPLFGHTYTYASTNDNKLTDLGAKRGCTEGSSLGMLFFTQIRGLLVSG